MSSPTTFPLQRTPPSPTSLATQPSCRTQEPTSSSATLHAPSSPSLACSGCTPTPPAGTTWSPLPLISAAVWPLALCSSLWRTQSCTATPAKLLVVSDQPSTRNHITTVTARPRTLVSTPPPTCLPSRPRAPCPAALTSVLPSPRRPSVGPSVVARIVVSAPRSPYSGPPSSYSGCVPTTSQTVTSTAAIAPPFGTSSPPTQPKRLSTAQNR